MRTVLVTENQDDDKISMDGSVLFRQKVLFRLGSHWQLLSPSPSKEQVNVPLTNQGLPTSVLNRDDRTFLFCHTFRQISRTLVPTTEPNGSEEEVHASQKPLHIKKRQQEQEHHHHHGH
jgi:hypothetical protein